MKDELVREALGCLFSIKFDLECGAPPRMRDVKTAIELLCDAMEDEDAKQDEKAS